MLRNVINNKYLTLLILSAFCISSAILGGSLLYGSKVHFDHHNVHIHHTNEDHGPGESDHRDANTILHLDYVVVNSSNPVKTLSSLNPYLHSYPSPNYYNNLFSNHSRITHCTNINKLHSHNLYQLNSSYLI